MRGAFLGGGRALVDLQAAWDGQALQVGHNRQQPTHCISVYLMFYINLLKCIRPSMSRCIRISSYSREWDCNEQDRG